MGAVGRPGFESGQRDDGGVVRRFGPGHDTAVVQDLDGYMLSGGFGELHLHRRVVVLRGDLDPLDGFPGNAFEPYGLPDAARGLVAETLPVLGHDLLADGLRLLFGGVPDAHVEHVARFADVVRDVERERVVASAVLPDAPAVHVDARLPVRGLEMQHDAFVLPVARHVEPAFVPQHLLRAEDVSHARKRRVDREGDQNLSRPGGRNGACRPAFGLGEALHGLEIAAFDRVVPFSVEVDPAFPFELRAGILRQGQFAADGSGEGRLHRHRFLRPGTPGDAERGKQGKG